MNVLISLHRGYGLGDAVQMSAVLRHVRKYRPGWRVSYQAEEGKHQVGRGLVANHFAYGQQPQDAHYDAEVLITLYETWHGFTDRPNTRVSSCLRDHFGLDWDAECGRYEVEVSREACHKACRFLDTFGMEPTRTIDAEDAGLGWGEEYPSEWLRYPIVAVHTEGYTAKDRKDLTHVQTEEVCDIIRRLGRVPVLMNNYSGDAEMNCAFISQCEAFVGIDSGPAKCASATDTPALVVWTGHHPAPFHDPAPNTTHLVLRGLHDMSPVRGDRNVMEWFDAHYRVRQYDGDPVGEVGAWLQEVLK